MVSVSRIIVAEVMMDYALATNKSIYLPDFRNEDWKVEKIWRSSPVEGPQGLCRYRDCTIKVDMSRFNPDIDLTLWHEVCHSLQCTDLILDKEGYDYTDKPSEVHARIIESLVWIRMYLGKDFYKKVLSIGHWRDKAESIVAYCRGEYVQYLSRGLKRAIKERRIRQW